MERIMFRGNPAFSSKSLENATVNATIPMTANGVIHKTLALLAFAGIGAAAIVYEAMLGFADKVQTFMVISLIAGFILALVTMFKPAWAKITAPLYAFAEGVALGAISLVFETMYPGIAFSAIALTFLSLFGMLTLYRMNILRATPKFRQTIMISMFAILALYLVNFIGSFFNFQIPMINQSGIIGIVFSLIVVAVASFSFILDFDNIEVAVKNFFHKDFEWYFAFSLMVTLVWLYVEMLRLLAKFRER